MRANVVPYRRPSLFVDYLRNRDKTDIDYERFLAYALRGTGS